MADEAERQNQLRRPPASRRASSATPRAIGASREARATRPARPAGAGRDEKIAELLEISRRRLRRRPKRQASADLDRCRAAARVGRCGEPLRVARRVRRRRCTALISGTEGASVIGQRLATTLGTPAMRNARARLGGAPSPPPWPTPVSHPESTTVRVLVRSSLAMSAATSNSAAPSRCCASGKAERVGSTRLVRACPEKWTTSRSWSASRNASRVAAPPRSSSWRG